MAKHFDKSARINRWDLASLTWMIGLMLLAPSILRVTGISWDEPTHWRWGEAKLDFWIGYLSGERTWGDFGDAAGSLVHPGLWDLSHAALMRWIDAPPWEIGHALSAVFGFAGMAAVWITGRFLGGPGMGLAALVLLTLTPRYFGHIWFNPKDIPFAACSAWALYFALRILRERRSPRRISLLGFGVAVGLSLGLRFAGFLVPFYLALFLLGCRIFNPEGETGLIRWTLTWMLRGSVVLGTALAVAFPFWPALWVTPATSVAEGASYAQSFDWDFPVLFDGRFINASELPFFYLPTWIGITLPIPQTLLLTSALGCLVWHIRRRWRDLSAEWLMVGMAVVFPVVYVMATDPILYDGMRHFLFVLPPIALLGAAGWQVLYREAAQRWAARGRLWATIFPISLLAMVGLEMGRLHPYYYIWFNPLVGGLREAGDRFETDYWGLAFQEAGLLAQAELPVDAELVVSVGSPRHLLEPFVPSSWTLVKSRESAEIYIATTRLNLHLARPGRVIGVVEREGAPLCVILRLEELDSNE